MRLKTAAVRSGMILVAMSVLAGCGLGQTDDPPSAYESGTLTVAKKGTASCALHLTPYPGQGQERQTKTVNFSYDFCRSAGTADHYELSVAPDGTSGLLTLYPKAGSDAGRLNKAVDFEAQ